MESVGRTRIVCCLLALLTFGCGGSSPVPEREPPTPPAPATAASGEGSSNRPDAAVAVNTPPAVAGETLTPERIAQTGEEFPFTLGDIQKELGRPTESGEGFVDYEGTLNLRVSPLGHLEVQTLAEGAKSRLTTKFFTSKLFQESEGKAALDLVKSGGGRQQAGRFEITARESTVVTGMVILTVRPLPKKLTNNQPGRSGTAPEPIAADAVAAWAKVGASVMWVRIDPERAAFEEVKIPKAGDLLVLALQKPIPPATLARLPKPSVPFGIRMPWGSPGGGPKVADGMLKELAAFPELRAVDLALSDVTGDGLLHLPRLKGLHSLNLGYTDFSGKTIDVLAKVEGLTTLSLRDAKIHPDAVGELAGCKRLAALDLSQTRVSDDGLKALAKCKSLRWLTLGDTRITGAGLRPLAAAGRLERLDLFACRELTDGDLAGLAPLTELATLDLLGTPIGDRGLAAVGKLERLKKLSLPAGVTDDGMKHLTHLAGLVELDAAGSGLADAGLRELAAVKGLTRLNLNGTRVTDDGLKALTRLGELRALTLSGTAATDGGLEHVGKLISLEELALADLKVTDDGLKHLTGLTRLRSLSLRGTRVTDDGLKELKELKQLQQVDLTHARVTPDGVTGLKKAMPGVTVFR